MKNEFFVISGIFFLAAIGTNFLKLDPGIIFLQLIALFILVKLYQVERLLTQIKKICEAPIEFYEEEPKPSGKVIEFPKLTKKENDNEKDQ